MDVAAYLKSIDKWHAALAVLQTLSLSSWRYPPSCTIANGTEYDFIIVGGGTAGSILGNRLSKNSSINVLVIEAGGYPPIEADDFPGLGGILPRSEYDYDYYGQNDNYTAQNLHNFGLGITAGKMLGGSGSLQHSLYTKGFPSDYDDWAEILGDDSWNSTNLSPYFKMTENIVDEDLRRSPYYNNYFGTNGTMDLTRRTSPIDLEYLAAFKELGYKIENVSSTLGYAETVNSIGDGIRHSTALRYLGSAKYRSNLCLSLFTTATKILFKNNTAKGVEVTTSNGDTITLYAKKEVIICAGAINSPKLLMLSGIGPKAHLDLMNIKVLADLPVGQNFQDHLAALVAYQMEHSTAPAISINPHEFPFPLFLGQVALNSTQSVPDYQAINMIIQHDSSMLLMVCVNMLKYSTEICQNIFDANKNRTLLLAYIAIMAPESRGQILLASSDPNDDPLIYPGTCSDESDLKTLAESLEDYDRVRNTTFFRSVNATLIDLNLCPNAASVTEFWQCYALKMTNTFFHYCGTCATGLVLDSNLQVKGMERIRVVDASSIPKLIRGKLNVAVNVLAEHAADIILNTYSIH